jgi:ABC-2 type transport system permease protein
MAVYKRTYRRYTGDLTPAWSRFLVLYRYSRQALLRSRLLTGFYVLCFFYPLFCAIEIYLLHNLDFVAKYGFDVARFISIDNKFFFYFIDVQGALAFILTAFTGPGLISPDLANGALPLYFCRPFSRAEYVAGKMSALALLLSQITWIPGLILFGIQASVGPQHWLAQNWWIAGSIVLASWIWIAILCLLSMALSAWVKWRFVAGALLLGVFFFGAGFGHAINAVMRTDAGSLIDISNLIASVWTSLFRIPIQIGEISAAQAWIALLIVCGICLFLLMRKVRAYEVIK